MATLFFGVSGPTLDLQEDLQIADSDAPRIMGYLMASAYGTVTENIIDGDTQSWVTRPATPEETATNYAKDILSSLLNATVTYEKAVASAAAANAVAPIIAG
jgi:hypothetical protein